MYTQTNSLLLLSWHWVQYVHPGLPQWWWHWQQKTPLAVLWTDHDRVQCSGVVATDHKADVEVHVGMPLPHSTLLLVTLRAHSKQHYLTTPEQTDRYEFPYNFPCQQYNRICSQRQCCGCKHIYFVLGPIPLQKHTYPISVQSWMHVCYVFIHPLHTLSYGQAWYINVHSLDMRSLAIPFFLVPTLSFCHQVWSGR